MNFLFHGFLILVLYVIQSHCNCSKCINCLPQPNQAMEGMGSVLDSGRCPVEHALEQTYLQQILYMFKGHQRWKKRIRRKVPCYSECSSCGDTILRLCKSMKPNFWDISFAGLFYGSQQEYDQQLSTTTTTTKAHMLDPSQSCSGCCKICSLVLTKQSFLVTSMNPDPSFGHSFHLLNFNMHNLRFHQMSVAGFCRCQVS